MWVAPSPPKQNKPICTILGEDSGPSRGSIRQLKLETCKGSIDSSGSHQETRLRQRRRGWLKVGRGEKFPRKGWGRRVGWLFRYLFLGNPAERFPVNLDFDARVPIPISVFPSTYRGETQVTDETKVRVEGEVDLAQRGGREGIESRYSYSASDPRRQRTDTRVYEEEDRFTSRRRPAYRKEEEVRVYEDDRRDRREEFDVDLEVERKRYREPYSRYADVQIDAQEQVYDREYRSVDRTAERPASRFTAEVDIREGRDYNRASFPTPAAAQFTEKKSKGDMGYYDEDGHYHSFRHGLHRAADRIGERILHPFSGGREEIREEVDVEVDRSAPRVRDNVRFVERRGGVPNTITIPCHHIRIGDLLILQGRPCQVIRITTSSSTGQHRYLGVDLFTKQLYEESSFASNPSPSVYVQNMLGPVFKQYRILDIREDGRIVAMTETGDIKQNLPVLDQGGLFTRLNESFAGGRGSVRVLVINDAGRELAVDYKVQYGARL